MSMSAGQMPGMGRGGMAMPGMSMGSGGTDHGAAHILPTWLAIAWMAAFLLVLASHARHAVHDEGERRWWHCGHVVMALGMAFMYAPSSVDPLSVAAATWRVVFGAGAVAVLGWLTAHVVTRRPVNALWPLLAIDMAAMVYMWSAPRWGAGVTWLLVAFFVVAAALWASDRMRRLDQRVVVGAGFGGAVNGPGAGALSATAVVPLVFHRDLRVSMTTMALGMAYMLAAMQLAM